MHGFYTSGGRSISRLDNGYSINVSAAYKAALIPILCVYSVYTISTFIAFIYRAVWLKDGALLERSVFLTSIHTACGIVFVANVLGHGIAKNYPCFIDVWLLIASYTTWMVTFIMFMLRYYVAIRSQYVLAKQARINPVTPENMVEYLKQLQSTTRNIFWVNTPEASESLTGSPLDRNSGGNRSADTQIPAFLANPINRRLSWIRDQLRPADQTESEPKQTSSRSRDSRQPTTGSDLPSLIESASQSLTISIESASRQLHDAGFVGERRLLERKRRQAKIWRCFLLDSFYAYVLCAYVLVLVGYITLMSTLFTRLKLSTIYYNCFSGPEYLPHVIISGIFNVIIGPVYGAIIWRYHDAYGIRNSLCFSFVLGALFWSGALAWRLVRSWQDKQISASLVYVAQVVFTHTLFITQPLIKSIRFSRSQKKGAVNAAQEPDQGLELDLATRCKSALDGVSRQSLLFALQNIAEHEAIRRFAESCFCIEMVTFLDVYQAFKKCAFQVLQDNQTNEALSADDEPCSNSNFAIPSAAPSIVITESMDAELGDMEHVDTPVSSNIFSFSAISHSSTRNSHRAHSNESGRTPNRLGRRNLPSMLLSGLDHADSRKARSSRIRRQRDEMNEANIHYYSVDIVDMLKQAFPDSDINESTTVSERLRSKLCEIIKTFILPNSPLELNIDARIVRSARSYMKGGVFSYHQIDEIKEAVIDLLYSNVYVRFRQSNFQQ